MVDEIEVTENYDDQRDWETPRDAAALADMLAAFGRLADEIAPGKSVMIAQSPSWFDDTYWYPQEQAVVADRCLLLSDPSVKEWLYSGYGEGIAVGEVAPGPEDAAKIYRERVEAALADQAGDEAPAFTVLLSAVHAGSFTRENVEAALHPLEAEEIYAFARPAGHFPVLAVVHSNGDTDVIYKLDPEGRLIHWRGTQNEFWIKDGSVPQLPTPSNYVVFTVAGVARCRVSKPS
jgi:hypothetical protein